MPCCAFSIYCPLMGVFFLGGDLRLGVCVHLSEVFVYGMVCLLEIVDAEFSQEMAGTSDWCPLMGGVCLWEVSAVGGGGGWLYVARHHPLPLMLCCVGWSGEWCMHCSSECWQGFSVDCGSRLPCQPRASPAQDPRLSPIPPLAYNPTPVTPEWRLRKVMTPIPRGN